MQRKPEGTASGRADRSALTVLIERIVADLLQKDGHATSSRVARLAREQDPTLVQRLGDLLVNNQLVAIARGVLKRTTHDHLAVEPGEGDARQGEFKALLADISPANRPLVPRTVAVPRKALEELGMLDRLKDEEDEEEERDATDDQEGGDLEEERIGRPAMVFVSVTRISVEELRAAVELLEKQVDDDTKRLLALRDLLRAMERAERRKSGGGKR